MTVRAAAPVGAVCELDSAGALVASAAPRPPRAARAVGTRLVPPKAVVSQPTGLIRLGVGGDGEQRRPGAVPAALGDVRVGQGTADRPGWPLRADRAALGH